MNVPRYPATGSFVDRVSRSDPKQRGDETRVQLELEKLGKAMPSSRT